MQTVAHGVSDIRQVVNIHGFFNYGNGNTGFIGFANTLANQYMSAFVDSTNIYIRANEPNSSGYGNNNMWVTIEYTKTTD